MKKLLIAGGGYADIPLIQAGKALGYHVITSGNRKEDLGHCYSDECRLADFSDEAAMLRLAQDARIDAICACCNDFSALSSAYVAQEMGLPGHDPVAVASIVHHKDRYREFARCHGIASPTAHGFDTPGTALAGLADFRFPVIVKPVDLTGGKGIAKASGMSEAAAAVAAAFRLSRAKRIVIEEFVEGTRHGISTFVRDGKVIFHFNDNEYYFQNPYLVSAASVPGTVAPTVVAHLIETIERIVSLLGLKTGIVHVQYIVNREGQPVIIEICRRAPGDLYVRLVQHATGIDYSAYIVRAAAGLDCSGLKQVEPRGFFTRHCVMTSRPGIVRDLVFDPSIYDNIVDRYLWWKPGDVITDVLTQKLGIVFLRFASMDEMVTKTEKMQELIRAEFERS